MGQIAYVILTNFYVYSDSFRRIKDPSPANTAASQIAGLSSDIYVLDETHFAYPSLWHTLTRNEPNHLLNGSLIANPDQQFAALQSTLLQDFSNMSC